MLSRWKHPAVSDPRSGKHGPRVDNRTKVVTVEGEHVLSSDVRLHLDKLKVRKTNLEAAQLVPRAAEEDEELEAFEKERRILERKLEKQKEIKRLQLELQ